MAKKRDFTIAEYLSHMGKAVVEANRVAIETTRDIITSNDLDSEIEICGNKIHMDGTSIVPEGWIRLDKMEIECESHVYATYDDAGEPAGLAMPMTRGLLRKGMHVKFKAKFGRSGMVEALEILRDASNKSLGSAIGAANLTTQVTPREEGN